MSRTVRCSITFDVPESATTSYNDSDSPLPDVQLKLAAMNVFVDTINTLDNNGDLFKYIEARFLLTNNE